MSVNSVEPTLGAIELTSLWVHLHCIGKLTEFSQGFSNWISVPNFPDASKLSAALITFKFYFDKLNLYIWYICPLFMVFLEIDFF